LPGANAEIVRFPTPVGKHLLPAAVVSPTTGVGLPALTAGFAGKINFFVAYSHESFTIDSQSDALASEHVLIFGSKEQRKVLESNLIVSLLR
jgi:hypothetical protein